MAAVASLIARGSLNTNDQAMCCVRDLSRNGIGLETGQPPIVGQGVLLRLAIDDEIHELPTRARRVVRRRDSHFYEVGLDWSNCSQEQLEFLDKVADLINLERLSD